MNLVKELIKDSLRRAISKLGLEGTEQAINCYAPCKLRDELHKEFNKMVRK